MDSNVIPTVEEANRQWWRWCESAAAEMYITVADEFQRGHLTGTLDFVMGRLAAFYVDLDGVPQGRLFDSFRDFETAIDRYLCDGFKEYNDWCNAAELNVGY